jgi:hypothetical protein
MIGSVNGKLRRMSGGEGEICGYSDVLSQNLARRTEENKEKLPG